MKQPLTDGELTLARYLDNNLPVEWEIYLQPYLNGDRPDIVIMNPNVGMMIIEVKDYKYGPYFSKPHGSSMDLFVKYWLLCPVSSFDHLIQSC